MRKRITTRNYLTGFEALNYHRYDWHSFAFKEERKYPEEIREWAGDYGVEKRGDREIASPIRAFLDYLFYTIRFKEIVPTYRVEDLLFDEKEEKEILEKIDKLLEPVLNNKEKELLHRWKNFNTGGEYEPVYKFLSKAKAWRERVKKNGGNVKDFGAYLKEAFNF